MQVAVAGKENEISAAPRLLRCLDLRGKLVMGDALLIQRELSIQIVDAGGEYVWAVKGNQPQLRQEIDELFETPPSGARHGSSTAEFQSARMVNKGHGRLEERTLTTSSLLNDYTDWPRLAQVFKLERRVTRLKDGSQREEVTYGLTSLTSQEAGPERLLTMTRSYWGIENGLHYRRGKTLREDITRMTHTRFAEAMAILNNLVLGLILQGRWRYLPHARRHYRAHLEEALTLILLAPG